MYKVAFDKEAEKEFLKLDTKAQKLIASKIIDLKNAQLQDDGTLIVNGKQIMGLRWTKL